MLEVLDAPALRVWVSVGRDALAAARAELDGSNVFPVADRDTGTNLLVTMTSVDEAVRALAVPPGQADLAALAEAACRAAVLGAHGSSGTILAQLLRGLLGVLSAGPADGAALARGLEHAADLAYAAVAAPVEGTVLSVARSAARGASSAGPRLGEVVSAAADAAEEALARTPELLPVLRAAGVVDAGGRGLLLLLRALEAVVHERRLQAVLAPLVPRDGSGVTAQREAGSAALQYEVQYLLHGASDEAVRGLRHRLQGLGDTVVVVGEQGLHNVHVHVDDVGAAIEAGVEAGRPSRIAVTRFADQVEAAARRRAVVVVVPGAGLARVVARAGAVVVAAEPLPTAEELLAVVRAQGCAEAVLLAHDDASSAVVREAAGLAAVGDARVVAVTAASPVQALAALAVAEPALPLDEARQAMGAAAAATRSAAVVRAAQAADTTAGPCLPGDALGVLDGAVALVGADVTWVGRGLLDLLAGAAELVTVVLGEGAPAGCGEALAAHAAEHHGHLRVTVVDGAVPRAALLLGAEQ